MYNFNEMITLSFYLLNIISFIVSIPPFRPFLLFLFLFTLSLAVIQSFPIAKIERFGGLSKINELCLTHRCQPVKKRKKKNERENKMEMERSTLTTIFAYIIPHYCQFNPKDQERKASLYLPKTRLNPFFFQENPNTIFFW